MMDEQMSLAEKRLQAKMERRAQEQREKAIRDHYSYMHAYKEEGLVEGREQGLVEGRKQGLEQGLKKGLQENKIENVVNGLKEGIDVNIIAKITKVSIQDIEKIKMEFNL